MKRFFTLFVLCFTLCAAGFSQRTVSGQITDESGEPLIGANIVGKGTSIGTVTDFDGAFSLDLADNVSELIVSYTGYATQEIDIPPSGVVDAILQEGIGLGEVVVTAVGIERQRKDLGYSISTVQGEELTFARTDNVVNSLAGKTSGVQITSQSGNLGGSSKILIRGVNSLSGNNNPLWVVDGVPIFDSNINTGSGGSNNDRITGGFDAGNRAGDINPDDIASISILKGATAAALYGSRASNGAIIVTTKRGKQGTSASVTVNSSIRFDNPLRLPDFQNEYAQGSAGVYIDDRLNGWGPKITGQTVTDFRGEEQVLRAHPDNVKDFYETGTSFINNVAISGGTAVSDYRLSISALNQEGIAPGSALDRYTFTLNSGMKLSDKFSSRFGASYVRTTNENRAAQGANDPNVLTSIVNGFPRTLDVNSLQPWKETTASGANQLNTVGPRTNNPYWIAYENAADAEVDRLYGNAELKYEPVLWLDVIGRLGYDVLTDDRFFTTSKGTINLVNGRFTEDNIQQRQIDFNFLVSANKDLSKDFFLRTTVGYNVNTRVFERLSVFAQDLTIDNLFSYGNTDNNVATNDFSERRLIGVYGDVTLTYKEWLSLNLTARNDWSSTLPTNNNSYFYPSASLSWIFTDALKIDSDILSYGKIRASYAQVGGDTGPYQLDFNYIPQTTAFGQFGTATSFPFNGNQAFSGPGTIPPGNSLNPEQVKSYEFGTELQFFNGRLGLDVTYYSTSTTDQIVPVAIPESTGYGFIRTNVGETKNEGFEAELSITPIAKKNFDWNMLATFTTNDFTVEELGDGVDRFVINSGFSGVQIVATPGESYQLSGTAFARADSDPSKIVVDPTTGLRTGGDNMNFGDVFPDFIAGLTNTFNWKNLALNFTLDWRNGGLLYSNTIQDIRSGGLAEETAVNREGSYVDRAAYIEQADGTLVENNIPVSVQSFWGAYTDSNIAEGSIFDASFLKVREIRLAYTFAGSDLGKLPFKSLSVGVEARNPFIIYSEIPHIDPESNLFGAANDGAGVEFNSLPTTRSIGVNLRLAL